MRLAVGLLVVALGGSIAWADDAKPATPKTTIKVPLRVVRVMPESHQALLFDRDRGTHVLAELGTQIDGCEVADIADDTVTLSANGTQIVLAAPEPDTHAAKAPKGATAMKPAATPVDPYDAPTTAATPADPYASAAAAPADPYADPAAAPVDPYGAATSTSPAVLVTTSEAPGLALTRGELTASLANFTKLSAGLQAAFTPAGVRVDAVATGSLFARAGLRGGDTITAVDGQPLRSLDDAAELYARAATARNVTISVLRAGKPASLHVTIK